MGHLLNKVKVDASHKITKKKYFITQKLKIAHARKNFARKKLN